MPLGLNRIGNFKDGFPATLPIEFNTPVTTPMNFGSSVTTPVNFGNDVTWPVPDPAHFGNTIGSAITTGLLMEDGVNFFELEDASGVFLLE